jgi:hypothetical protein
MNYQRTSFTPVPMHQDGATVSAFQFNRRIEHLQCWRRRGRRFSKRRWNDLESLFSKGGHGVLPKSGNISSTSARMRLFINSCSSHTPRSEQ